MAMYMHMSYYVIYNIYELSMMVNFMCLGHGAQALDRTLFWMVTLLSNIIL